jgi:hypothetical protein
MTRALSAGPQPLAGWAVLESVSERINDLLSDARDFLSCRNFSKMQ